MDEYPPEVEQFHRAIRRLPGVADVGTGVQNLEGLDVAHLSLVDFGDWPHAVFRRSQGALVDEVWIHPEIEFEKTPAGWRSLEFLAWWVRDQSRGGENMQMRPQALPPIAVMQDTGRQIQLGQTLKFLIDILLVASGDNLRPALAKMQKYAESLDQAIDLSEDAIFQ